MTIGQANTEALIAPLSLARGGFAMLALDQRESLRAMFARAGRVPVVGDEAVGDDTLRRFKRQGIEILTPHASGVLLDRPLAVTGERPAGIAPGCGLILAADVLHHAPGGHIGFTSLDPLVTPAFIERVGAVAIKLLVIWRAGRDRAERADRCPPSSMSPAGLVSRAWSRASSGRMATSRGRPPASATRRSSPRPRSSPPFGRPSTRPRSLGIPRATCRASTPSRSE
jgi:hypothetical protein